MIQEPLVFLEIEGFLEMDRKEYFLKYFQDEYESMRAFDLTKSNAALFHMCSTPMTDKDNENYYSFVHVNIQQFLAAIFYILRSEEKDQDNHRRNTGDI
ncbi:PREDICTED: NACHT, LRR and PYD domains-containing protein 2-like [Chrysochloris asiatica]|uniref:NACHT, LRR and PYD domains-containing protein 2-like n=1 Tax=Chrysochloris asiatica TaxID=185453 RepID=A0A9B0TNS6_CHRAS|nr:PREDICTED: NACHT, LRR and PYD domains-containing protein 2-like [Chrysochloris asiatica]